jgi:stage II sporulation protein GA (sporulation sigma-E factor processing peptidase)
MDYFLLLFVKRIFKSPTTHLRILIGSLIGALGMCILVVLPIKSIFLNLILGHIIINTCMVKVACNIKTGKQLLKGVISLYISAFLLGGVFQTMSYYTNIKGWIGEIMLGNGHTSMGVRAFLMFSVISYIMILICLKVYERLKNKISNIYEVRLYFDNREILLKGFNDTGNRLKDPLSGKPVSVIERDAVKALVSEEVLNRLDKMSQYSLEESSEESVFGNLHYIPFHSIGKESGLMPALTIDCMQVQAGEVLLNIQNPVIGVCGFKVSAKADYQMILNSMLIED